MNTQAVIGSLKRRGEVPPPGTDDRRSWLLALTGDELNHLTRYHGTDQDVFSDCLGFGAYHAGTDIDEAVPCDDCGQIGMALWFVDPAGLTWVRCWRCSAIRHLTTCEKWTVTE